MRHLVPLMAALFILSACSPDTGDTGPPLGPGTTTPTAAPALTAPQPSAHLAGLELDLIASGFDQPTYATALPGDDRIFVLERTGLIRILKGGEVAAEPFLDLTAEVSTEGPEQGLTALAFHPRYEENGRLFVFFTDVAGASQLFEYERAADDPDAADPRSGRRILELEQPHPAHQGGALVFGPDGYLWVTIGDGGVPSSNGNDWRMEAQDPTNWYGSVLRLDIDAASPYAIPPDNPFAAGEGGAPEVWAYGFRNPWRATTDGGTILISDVGQDWWEEVNVIPLGQAGGNYGWPVLEGPECFEAETCDTEGLIEPTLAEYHEGLCAIIAGPVYRGPAIPELHGQQFYSDYCVGWIRSWDYTKGVQSGIDWTGDLGKIGNASSLGVDGNGEMLIMNLAGDLYRIVPVR
jgi:glucose/arabinose dehydrogenase